MKWFSKILLYIVLIPIELLGILIKPFSLLIRLYANMQAGHIVIMSIIGLMFIFKSWLGSPLSFGLAFAISIIELLVAFIQAYIFTMLSIFILGLLLRNMRIIETKHLIVKKGMFNLNFIKWKYL